MPASFSLSRACAPCVSQVKVDSKTAALNKRFASLFEWMNLLSLLIRIIFDTVFRVMRPTRKRAMQEISSSSDSLVKLDQGAAKLELTWQDQTCSTFHHIWLRDNWHEGPSLPAMSTGGTGRFSHHHAYRCGST
ncbi:MAG: hypothetical protein HKN05_23570 [Rhizobiales bacterium]|nr:hypothetical protein [Hyphomicrobiales bacterium]